MAEITLTIQRLQRLKADLQNPERTLRKIGALLITQAEKAFSEQRFGTTAWPEIYHGEGSPFVNVAGVVSDISKGSPPASRRFSKKKPALINTGELLRSLKDRNVAVKAVGQYAVEYGTKLQYAPIHQFGGVSVQQITSSAKETLADFLKKKANKKYRGRLGFLFKQDKLETQVSARPFIGVTAETAIKIKDTVERDLTEGR